MNRKGYEIERCGHNYTVIHLEGQRQTMKDFRVAGLRPRFELWTSLMVNEFAGHLSRRSAVDR